MMHRHDPFPQPTPIKRPTTTGLVLNSTTGRMVIATGQARGSGTFLDVTTGRTFTGRCLT